MFQIRLPLLFGDLLFDLLQHSVIKCISVDSDSNLVLYVHFFMGLQLHKFTYVYAARSAEEANESKQGNLFFSHVELVQGCFVFGNDAQRNANKGTQHTDERPLAVLDTKNVLTNC